MQIILPKFSLNGLFFIGIAGAYLFGKMFYVGGAGAAQPADIAMAGAFLLLITPQALARLAGVNVFIVLLMCWAIAVNIGWALISSDREFITTASYYAFNLGVIAAVFWTRQRNPRLFDFVIPGVVLASVLLQVFMITFVPSGYRSQGTFANPNQLAFWSLCSMTMWILARPRRIGFLDLAVIGALVWVELHSLSRAGMGAMSLLILVWLVRTVRTFRARVIAVGVTIAGAFLLSLTPAISSKLSQAEMVSKAEARIQRQQTMSEMEYRGYDRILEFTGHIVLGAGEGKRERFADPTREIEIHSTFGTLLFSYGILGITLFFAFVWRLTRTVAFDRYVYLAPALAYGVTHNGLRFSFFWFMVAMLLSFAITEGRQFAPQRRPLPPMRPAYRGGEPVSARGPAAGR